MKKNYWTVNSRKALAAEMFLLQVLFVYDKQLIGSQDNLVSVVCYFWGVVLEIKFMASIDLEICFNIN